MKLRLSVAQLDANQLTMYDVWSTMKIKSVIAGEYTAPPAQGPIITDI